MPGVLAPARDETKPILVSFIVLSLHGAEMLRTLFSSIARHNTWPDIEVLVVDHGGDEDTAHVIREAGKELNIRHLNPGRNFSFAFSCNRATQIARGDVVLFLNNDIEFTEDIVPEIVARARSGENLVGVKFWYVQPNGESAPRPQTGIRFRWNERQGWTVPYEAMVEGPSADRPCEIPAITAAVLGISRQRMLDMGGFHEHYLYAYEDVDLCLKAGTRFGMKSISLNNLSARHMWGATRFKRSSRKRRRDWHRYNMSVFRSRCGYLSRRLAWLGLFDAAGFDWGRGPAISWIGKEENVPASLGSSPGFDVVRPDFAGYNVYGCDVVVCGNPETSPDDMRHLGPMALRIAWLSGSGEDWVSVADFYDVLVADTEATAAMAARHLDRPIYSLGEPGIAAGLGQLLAEFIELRFRVLVISPAQGEASALAALLRRDGHSVHVRDSIEPRETLRYDVAIWFEPPVRAPASGTIHVAAHEVAEDRYGFYDVSPGHCRNPATWLARAMPGIRACHEKLMAGPHDPPLEDISFFDDAGAEMFWRSYDDPTFDLIGDAARLRGKGT